MATIQGELVPRWYFGGLAAAGAACVTHPLDLIKVQMQTHKGKNVSVLDVVKMVLAKNGVLGLYSGISASVLRQLTYSTVRFGIYETLKQHLLAKSGRQSLPFYQTLSIAGIGGFFGGFAGNPADLVNVRMQNDVKLPPEQRRDYKNALHGIYRVARTEGVSTLWTGVSMNSVRSALMTIGQVAFYDQIKMLLLRSLYFEDNMITHITASLGAFPQELYWAMPFSRDKKKPISFSMTQAMCIPNLVEVLKREKGAVATSLTQPVDVIKTRAMNAKPGEPTGMITLFFRTAKEGPLAFFKGYLPAFVRLAPHSVFTFVFLEQLTLYFGILKIKQY